MKKLLLTLYAVIIIVKGIAQPGSLDATFNPNAFTGANGNIYTTITKGNKIIIGGDFTKFNVYDRNSLARLNSYGTIDTTFSPTTGANNIIKTTSNLSSNKLFIGGDFTSYNGVSCNRAARINNDGSIDNTFNIGTGANSSIYASGGQSTNKVIIAGDFTSFNGNTANGFARLNSDGSFDTGFNTNLGTGINGAVKAIVIKYNDKIQIAGDFTSVNGVSRNGIALLNSNGTLDTSFDPGIGANGPIYTIAVQENGSVIISGDFTSVNGVARNKIARLSYQGILETSFDPGTGINAYATSIAVQSINTNIIICGAFTSYNGTNVNQIAYLSYNGTLISTFLPGSAANNPILTLITQSDGKIIISGLFNSFNGHERNRITRINVDGSIDETFELPGLNIRAAVSLQTDGKIIISGQLYQYNSIPINGICRLNENGSIDTSFDAGEGAVGFFTDIVAHAFQPDGKIIIGGGFTSYDGTNINRIARLNSDGSLDPTFNPGSGIGTVTDNFIQQIVIQNDGKILIGGLFSTYNGVSRKYIARINSDGSLDNTFNPGTGFNSTVNTINLLSNGQILVAGNFLSYNGTISRSIALLNSDGSLDLSLNPGNGANYSIFSTLVQNDGKIIIAGRFTTFNNNTANYIVRLNTDGSIDPSFITGTGASSEIYKTLLQSDGKIIIAGRFTSYNGISTSRLARLNSDGSLDLSFDSGLGPNDYIGATGALQNDGKILISGEFNSYDGIGRNHIARINGDNIPISIDENDDHELLTIYPNPASNFITIEKSAVSSKQLAVKIFNTQGQLVYQCAMNNEKLTIDISALSKGIYIINIFDGEKQAHKKIVKE